ATRVRLYFFAPSCEVFFTRFQFAEAARTEGPEGVADSVQEPDLRLQGGSVAPRRTEQGIRELVALDPSFFRFVGNEARQIHIARASRPVGCAVRLHHLRMRLRDG